MWLQPISLSRVQSSIIIIWNASSNLTLNIGRFDSALCFGIKQRVGTCPSDSPAALNIGASMNRRVGTVRSRRAVSKTKSEEARATKFCLPQLLSHALA